MGYSGIKNNSKSTHKIEHEIKLRTQYNESIKTKLAHKVYSQDGFSQVLSHPKITSFLSLKSIISNNEKH